MEANPDSRLEISLKLSHAVSLISARQLAYKKWYRAIVSAELNGTNTDCEKVRCHDMFRVGVILMQLSYFKETKTIPSSLYPKTLFDNVKGKEEVRKVIISFLHNVMTKCFYFTNRLLSYFVAQMLREIMVT